MVCHMYITRNGVANGELLACWDDFCAADGKLMRNGRNDALPSHWLRTHDERLIRKVRGRGRSELAAVGPGTRAVSFLRDSNEVLESPRFTQSCLLL
jgi:hypothetical protein